jgi:hypothetical protein
MLLVLTQAIEVDPRFNNILDFVFYVCLGADRPLGDDEGVGSCYDPLRKAGVNPKSKI